VKPLTDRIGPRQLRRLTVEEAQGLVRAAAGVPRADGMRKRRGPYRLHGYVVLLLTPGSC
jgi:hypothetical protein